jgi:uncharacterized protein YfaT (DUF1175 family)
MKALALGGGVLLAAAALAAALAPVRHRAWVERSEGNPVQRVVLESRSLLGLRRPAWGARVEGTEAWGGAGTGFFVAPKSDLELRVVAWPTYRRALSIHAVPMSENVALLGQGDREAFRTWFVALLEQQLDGPSPAWEPAQRDCAGLLRFAFHEAWGPHTEAWRARTGFSASPVATDPAARLAGPWRQAFPTPGGWQPFAKGTFLRAYACMPLGRELAEAQPGDLLFFARGGARPEPDHAMAFVRPDLDGQPMLLYHTGPEGTGLTRKDGELRRVRLEDLLHHPEAEFRPLPENPAFLGIYRWKVLCSGLERASLSEPSLPSQP